MDVVDDGRGVRRPAVEEHRRGHIRDVEDLERLAVSLVGDVEPVAGRIGPGVVGEAAGIRPLRQLDRIRRRGEVEHALDAVDDR